MSYKISKYGNIIKVTGELIELIPMDESSSAYQEYLQFLKSNGTVEQSELFTQEEEITIKTPDEVALWKLRFLLSQMQLEQSVIDAINQLQEPQKTAANYIWNYGNSIDRYSTTVMFIQSVLQLSNNEVDNIFVESNNITL